MVIVKHFITVCLSIFLIATVHAENNLHEMNGHNISFAELQGKWVFINYWASWCRPCLEEIPELNRFYDENKTKNVAMFAVNYDALPVDAQKRLIKKFDIRYPSLKNDPAEDLQLGDIRGVPVTFVFNPNGQLINALYGGQSVRSLKQVMHNNY